MMLPKKKINLKKALRVKNLKLFHQILNPIPLSKKLSQIRNTNKNLILYWKMNNKQLQYKKMFLSPNNDFFDFLMFNLIIKFGGKMSETSENEYEIWKENIPFLYDLMFT